MYKKPIKSIIFSCLLMTSIASMTFWELPAVFAAGMFVKTPVGQALAKKMALKMAFATFALAGRSIKSSVGMTPDVVGTQDEKAIIAPGSKITSRGLALISYCIMKAQFGLSAMREQVKKLLPQSIGNTLYLDDRFSYPLNPFPGVESDGIRFDDRSVRSREFNDTMAPSAAYAVPLFNIRKALTNFKQETFARLDDERIGGRSEIPVKIQALSMNQTVSGLCPKITNNYGYSEDFTRKHGRAKFWQGMGVGGVGMYWLGRKGKSAEPTR